MKSLNDTACHKYNIIDVCAHAMRKFGNSKATQLGIFIEMLANQVDASKSNLTVWVLTHEMDHGRGRKHFVKVVLRRIFVHRIGRMHTWKIPPRSYKFWSMWWIFDLYRFEEIFDHNHLGQWIVELLKRYPNAKWLAVASPHPILAECLI